MCVEMIQRHCTTWNHETMRQYQENKLLRMRKNNDVEQWIKGRKCELKMKRKKKDTKNQQKSFVLKCIES